MSECMYTALGWGENYSIDVNQTHNKHINLAIKDALGPHRTMLGVISEAKDPTLTEGEWRGHRLSRGLVSVRFVLILKSNIYIENIIYITIPS